METQTKDVPSNDVVTTFAFFKAAVFMTVIPFVLFLMIWKIKVVQNETDIVMFGVLALIVAGFLSQITSGEPNPVFWVFIDNLLVATIIWNTLGRMVARTGFPIWGLIIAMIILNMMFARMRRIGLSMRYAIIILFIQFALLQVGLYTLRQFIT